MLLLWVTVCVFHSPHLLLLAKRVVPDRDGSMVSSIRRTFTVSLSRYVHFLDGTIIYIILFLSSMSDYHLYIYFKEDFSSRLARFVEGNIIVFIH